jgi:hypothetical protein
MGFVATDRFRHPEVWESEVVATNLLEGRGFTYETLGTPYRSYMEPLYPALCAAVYRVTDHSFLAMGLVQVLLGTALVWLVMVCALSIALPPVALVAGLLAAVDPGLIVYTTKLHPFVLDTALWFSAFAAVLAFNPVRPWRSTIVTGGLVGLCLLTRPTILACLPVMAWWMWTRSTDALRERALRCAVLGLCIAAVAAPWVWRNYQVHHRLMLTRSGTAFVFWLGNNPYLFTGSAMTPDGVPVINRVPPAVRAELSRRDEVGQQDYFSDESFAFIRAQPMAFVRRWVAKFGYFWWFSPQAGQAYPSAWFRLFQVVNAALLALALLGVVIGWQEAAGVPARRGAILLILGCCLSISVLQSLYYVEGRHRLAIEPFLLMFAGIGVVSIARRMTPQA